MTVLSIGSFSYLTGKLLLGSFGDRFGGRATFAGSLALTGAISTSFFPVIFRQQFGAELGVTLELTFCGK